MNKKTDKIITEELTVEDGISREEQSREQKDEKRLHRPSYGGNIVPAFFFIFLGLLFLANNLGIVPWYVWAEIRKFWPVFLILLGFQFLLGKSVVARIFMVLISVGVLFFIFIYILAAGGALKNTGIEQMPMFRSVKEINRAEIIEETYTVSGEDYTNVSSRKVEIESGIGKLVLNETDTQDYLILTSEYPDTFNKPEIKSELEDGLLSIIVSGRGRNGFSGMPDMRFTHSVAIGRPDIPTEIALQVGAGAAEIQLDLLTVNTMSVDVGVGSANVALTDDSVPAEDLTLHVGVGSITVTVPEIIGLEIDHNVGLGRFNINGQTLRGDGTFRTDNFSTAARKLRISADVGTGSISIERK